MFHEPAGVLPEKNSAHFETAADARAYITWKKTVPLPICTIVERAHQGLAPEFSETKLPLTDQFLRGLADSVATRTLQLSPDAPKIIHNTLGPLARLAIDDNTTINVFEKLASSTTSWELKLTLYETQIKPALEWLIAKDIAMSREHAVEQETKEVSEQSDEQPDTHEAPPSSEEVMSSMEAEDKNETEKENDTEKEPARPHFTVTPFRGGFFGQRIFGEFDNEKLTWVPMQKIFTPARTESYDPTTQCVLAGKIRGNTRLALPFQKNWTFISESFSATAPRDAAKLEQDQHGVWYLTIAAEGTHTYSIGAARTVRQQEQLRSEEQKITGALPRELTEKIAELRASRAPVLVQARALVRFVRDSLTYSNSKDAWDQYAQDPDNFFTELWKRKEADCHVSNTCAVRALLELGVRAQFLGGYFVKEKNEQGDAVLHGGNGHAKLRVWDAQSAQYIELDATPAGDPNVDQNEQEKELNEAPSSDDEKNDELMSSEEAEEQLEQLDPSEKKKPKEKKPPVDREASVFAGLANCTPEQAKEFLRAVERVRAIKNEQGQSISEELIHEWQKIIEERVSETHDYRGPVRMSEGDHLDDPVMAFIDVQGGDHDPSGFEKEMRVEQREKVFGGITLYFSFDLSGSMALPDGSSGRTRADVQRDTALLFIDSIMQCAFLARQAEPHLPEELPIKIMVTVASGTGSVALPLTDKWGPEEQWAMYAALTQCAKGTTPTHTTLKLIEVAHLEERLKLVNKNIAPQDMPLQYATVISDGEPDDAEQTERVRQRLVKNGMVTRTFCIGGDSDSPDAAPRLESFSQLPQELGRDILEQFKRLHPHRVNI